VCLHAFPFAFCAGLWYTIAVIVAARGKYCSEVFLLADANLQFARKKRRRSPLLAFLFLTAGLSFAIAGVWQLLSPKPAIEEPFSFDPAIVEKYHLSPESSEPQTSESEPASEPEADPQSEPANDSAAVGDLSSSDDGPDAAEINASALTAESSEIVPAQPPPAESGLVYLSDARPVPQSERVLSTYFDDAVFIGDSITTGISLYDVMSNTTVWASTGASLTNILTREIATVPGVGDLTVLSALDAVQPAKIYILLGANSLAANLDDVIAVYSSTLDQIIAHAPNAVIYVQSAFPINEALYSVKYNNIVTNAIIDDFNSRLLALCGQKGVNFLDVNSYFRDETGGLSAEDTSDGLHIHSALYLDWFDYLKTHSVS